MRAKREGHLKEEVGPKRTSTDVERGKGGSPQEQEREIPTEGRVEWKEGEKRAAGRSTLQQLYWEAAVKGTWLNQRKKTGAATEKEGLRGTRKLLCQKWARRVRQEKEGAHVGSDKEGGSSRRARGAQTRKVETAEEGAGVEVGRTVDGDEAERRGGWPEAGEMC